MLKRVFTLGCLSSLLFLALAAVHSREALADSRPAYAGRIAIVSEEARTEALIMPAAGGSPLGEGSSGDAAEAADSLDNYDDLPLADSTIADPLEPWNRFWFHFNDIFYLYIARPAYDAWVFITPHQVRGGLKNFFSNLLFPVRFVNNILQFRFMEAGVEFGRFVINTTSSLGLADVAKGHKTIVPVDPTGEDFGQTMGRWGIGQGFYLVWPIIGPSSARDTIGRVGDLFTDPLFYLKPWELGAGVGGGLRFNALGDVLPLYEDLNSVALDPYLAMREAYVNFRKSQVIR